MTTNLPAFEIARSTGWLAAQSADFQREMQSRCVIRTFRKDEAVSHYGEPCPGVYGLVKGTLKLEIPLLTDFKVASTKRAVCWFGQAACLRKGAFLVSLTASSAVTLLFLPRNEFETLIQDAAHCRAFALLTVDHYEEAIGTVASLLLRDTDARIVVRLAQLAIQSGSLRPSVLLVSQDEIAQMCGASRSTVFKVLSRLEAAGLIDQSYRSIVVKDPDLLLQSLQANA